MNKGINNKCIYMHKSCIYKQFIIYIKIFRVYSSLLFTLTALETDFHINLCACVEICMLENSPT